MYGLIFRRKYNQIWCCPSYEWTKIFHIILAVDVHDSVYQTRWNVLPLGTRAAAFRRILYWKKKTRHTPILCTTLIVSYVNVGCTTTPPLSSCVIYSSYAVRIGFVNKYYTKTNYFFFFRVLFKLFKPTNITLVVDCYCRIRYRVNSVFR